MSKPDKNQSIDEVEGASTRKRAGASATLTDVVISGAGILILFLLALMAMRQMGSSVTRGDQSLLVILRPDSNMTVEYHWSVSDKSGAGSKRYFVYPESQITKDGATCIMFEPEAAESERFVTVTPHFLNLTADPIAQLAGATLLTGPKVAQETVYKDMFREYVSAIRRKPDLEQRSALIGKITAAQPALLSEIERRGGGRSHIGARLYVKYRLAQMVWELDSQNSSRLQLIADALNEARRYYLQGQGADGVGADAFQKKAYEFLEIEDAARTLKEAHAMDLPKGYEALIQLPRWKEFISEQREFKPEHWQEFANGQHDGFNPPYVFVLQDLLRYRVALEHFQQQFRTAIGVTYLVQEGEIGESDPLMQIIRHEIDVLTAIRSDIHMSVMVVLGDHRVPADGKPEIRKRTLTPAEMGKSIPVAEIRVPAGRGVPRVTLQW